MKKITLLLILLIISIGGFSQVFTAGIPQAIDVTATPIFKGLKLSRQITLPAVSSGVAIYNVGGNIVVKDSVGTKTVPYLENTNVFSNDNYINNIRVGLGGGSLISNTVVGNSAGFSNTTGTQNLFMGSTAGYSNTTGSDNTIIGRASGESNTTGTRNTFFGTSAGRLNVSGNDNAFFGGLAGINNTTGNNNSFFGGNAGRYISGGSTANTISNNSVFVGFETKAAADNQTNQIVVGYQATGLGSNTTVLGNSSTTFTRIYGKLGLGTNTNAGYDLDVNGISRFSGNVDFSSGISGNSVEIAKAASVAVTGDGTYQIAFGGSILGTYTIQWAGTNRNEKYIVQVSTQQYDIANITVLSSFSYGNMYSLSNFRVVGSADGSVRYFVVDIANRNSSTGFLTVSAVGSNINLFPSAAVAGSTVVTNNRNTLNLNGNVGIGTAAPTTKLVVSNSGAEGFEVNPNGSNINLTSYNRSTSTYAAFRSISNSFLWQVGTSPVDKMILDTNGNLGIGATTPTSKLQVVGLPVYADNTAALAGGLTAGAFYRTSTGVLMVAY